MFWTRSFNLLSGDGFFFRRSTCDGSAHRVHLKALVLGLVAIGLVIVEAQAVKVDWPLEAEQNATHILTGTVQSIYAKTDREKDQQVTRCVAEVRVEGIEKGQGIASGQLVYVRYIGAIQQIGERRPGPGPHENIPSEGEKRRICLVRTPDGGLDVYYVSGFKSVPADSPPKAD